MRLRRRPEMLLRRKFVLCNTAVPSAATHHTSCWRLGVSQAPARRSFRFACYASVPNLYVSLASRLVRCRQMNLGGIDRVGRAVRSGCTASTGGTRGASWATETRRGLDTDKSCDALAPLEPYRRCWTVD